MPTSIDDPPATETATAGGLASKLSAVAIVVASIGTIAILFLFLTNRNDQIAAVQPDPTQAGAPSETLAAPPSEPVAEVLPPPAPTLPPPAPMLPSAPTLVSAGPAVDSQGFVDSKARCPTGQDTAAIARTARATIVICDKDGDYTYRGVRVEDGAFLELDDVRPMPAGFEARNNETTYRLSPAELVVISGETLQSRDPMVDYQAG